MRKSIVACGLVISLVLASGSLAAIGTYWGATWGPPSVVGAISNNGASTFAMAGLNSGWSARHVAGTVLDVKSIKIAWSSVATAGQVTIRYETDDATTGKPTGTLYDAAAVLTAQVPVAGVQTYTFAVLPTTARTVGVAYHVVVLTTTGGTTQTISSGVAESSPSSYPAAALTAADGTTRSNFAEVSTVTPNVVLVMEDDTEVSLEEGMSPFSTTTTNNLVTTFATGSKVVLPYGMTVTGVDLMGLVKVGTPAGDLRIRIFDNADAAVAGTTVTVDKDHLITGASGKGSRVRFIAPVVLAAGTYRIVADCASCANSSNCWRMSSADGMDATAVPSGWVGSTIADVTATPPLTWTESTTKLIPMRLIMTTLTAPATAGGVIGG